MGEGYEVGKEFSVFEELKEGLVWLRKSWGWAKMWNKKKLERSQNPDHSGQWDLNFTPSKRKDTERF